MIRKGDRASLEAAQSEVKRIDRELDTLLDLILKGGAADRINAQMGPARGTQNELEHFLADATNPRRFAILRWRPSTGNKRRPCT